MFRHMLNFRPICIEDRNKVNQILSKSDFRGSEYCFVNNYMWSNVYDISIYIDNYFCVLKFIENGVPKFSFPAGSGDIDNIINKIIDYCNINKIILHLTGINEDTKKILENNYDNKFKYQEDRDKFDYIYLADDLSNLAGKKYHSKRNHINRFLDNDWTFEMINEKNIHLCKDMSREWCILNECEKDEDKKKEMVAVGKLLDHFFELGVQGGILKVSGKVVGYTIGERLNSDTFIVHVEKAFFDIQGAYTMINREFSKYIFSNNFKYINREEDLGIEGLRKAKLSYKPEILYKKYTATII